VQPTTDSTLPTIKKRAYNGPQKGSAEAKERMQRVREAQWAKNGLSKGSGVVDAS